MADGSFLDGANGGLAVLAAGGGLAYVATRAAVDAIAGRSAEKLAVGYWVPFATAAIVATALNRIDLAMSILFPASVGAVLLVGGAAVLFAPPRGFRPAARPWRVAMVVCVVCYLIAFWTSLNWLRGLILVVQGGIAILAMRGTTGIVTWTKPRSTTVATGVLAVSTAGAAAWLCVIGIDRMIGRQSGLTVPLVGGTLVTPMLLLPMIGISSELSQRGKADAAVNGLAGFVILNLCGSVPLVLLTAWGRWALFSARIHYRYGRPVVPMPWVAWRLDLPVLILSTAAILVACGLRAKPGRTAGVVMMAAFAGYVVYTVVMVQVIGR